MSASHLPPPSRQQSAAITPCLCIHVCTTGDLASTPKGIVLLDTSTSVKRTKNIRDGFEYCLRIDSPNAAANPVPGAKHWTKLVIALRSEVDLRAWVAAIQSGIGYRPTESRMPTFDASVVRTGNMVVHQGPALKEVASSASLRSFVHLRRVTFASFAGALAGFLHRRRHVHEAPHFRAQDSGAPPFNFCTFCSHPSCSEQCRTSSRALLMN